MSLENSGQECTITVKLHATVFLETHRGTWVLGLFLGKATMSFILSHDSHYALCIAIKEKWVGIPCGVFAPFWACLGMSLNSTFCFSLLNALCEVAAVSSSSWVPATNVENLA